MAALTAATWTSSSACSSSSDKRRPVVIAADGLGQQIELARQRVAVFGSASFGLAGSHCFWTVRRWTRRVRANASIDDSRRCCRPVISRPAAACLRLGLAAEPLFAQLAVLVQQGRKPQLGGVGGQAVDVDLHDVTLGETALDLADVVLEPADHDVVEHLLLDGHAAAEALRVEDLQQGGEAVGVAVVRRGRQEQPMLEPRGQVADGPGDLRVDGVLLAAGRGGVVGLVQDEQRAAAEVAQPVAERAGVGFVDQEPMRDEEPGVGAPGIDAEAALAADPLHVLLVEDLEGQAEAVLQLVLPLVEHRRRAGRRRSRGPSCGAAARGRSARPRWSCRGRRRRR